MPHPGNTATSRDELRRSNLAAIFGLIHREGPIARNQLARTTGLSAATVTSLTADLIRTGLVYEAEEGVSIKAGRKPILLEVNYDHAHVVGVKLSAETITVALTNLHAEIRASARISLENHAPASVAGVIADGVRRLAEEAGVPTNELVGLCLSLPGIVDNETGRVRHSPLPSWSEAPLADLVGKRLAMPVSVENDVNALAVAEAWFGSGRDHLDFLVVTLGRGVGLGIVLNGSVYRGPLGGAGEFGHSVLSFSVGGHTETVEDQLSDDAILREARLRFGPAEAPASIPELVALAAAENQTARDVLAVTGTTLGVALSTLVNILAPNLIVLSGESACAAPFLLPTARLSLRRHSFGDLADTLDIVVEPLGDEAWARGAAGLAASRYLSNASILEVIHQHTR